MNRTIKIVFKSGRIIRLRLGQDESFIEFWKKVTKREVFIFLDIMFNVKEVESAEIE